MRILHPSTQAVLRHPGAFAWQTLRAFRANQGLLLAGAVAYYALLSIVPTMRILAWRRALKADHAFSPPPDEIRRVRHFLAYELIVFPLIPIFAAAMAMGYGVGWITR